jgi:hypothetical protein
VWFIEGTQKIKKDMKILCTTARDRPGTRQALFFSSSAMRACIML